MQVTFLGTGTSAGVPVIGCTCAVCNSNDQRDKRLRCSALIEIAGLTLVIDLGPDFRQQLLREKVTNVDAVLITHPHRDHIGGLDEIRALNFINQKHIDIYCNEFSEIGIRELHPYVFKITDYPYLPRLEFRRIENDPFSIAGLSITPVQVMHAEMPVVGFRINDFTYITDAKTISEEELEKVKGTKTLVLNALRYEEHYSHFTIPEAIAVAQKINAERTYFLHMNHQAGKYEDLQAQMPEGIFIAYDGLKIEA
jgi:phosphoribosyl 1,2-cyclic phosphate phosphodiesterase